MSQIAFIGQPLRGPSRRRNSVTSKQREVFQIIGAGDATSRQAAEWLGITPIAARMRVYRARKKLRANGAPASGALAV